MLGRSVTYNPICRSGVSREADKSWDCDDSVICGNTGFAAHATPTTLLPQAPAIHFNIKPVM